MQPNHALVRFSALAVTLGLLTGLVACDDATGPSGEPDVSLSVVLAPGSSPGIATTPGNPSGHLTLSDGEHQLVLTRVAVVVREVELERMNDDDCDDLVGESHDACEAFSVGPVLVEVPLDGTVLSIMATEVPADIYDELEFEIHKPDDDTAADRQFLLEHPDFKGVSVRVEGSFDDDSFVFLQDLNEERELGLVPPLVVEESQGDLNLTMALDVESWFVGPAGGLIDPRTANKGGPMEDHVEGRIKASISAFADEDRDGHDG